MTSSAHLPRVPGDVVPVPAVGAALDKDAPLVVLRAPAGYGKTTAVAAWARGLDADVGAVVWLSATDDPPLAQLAEFLGVEESVGTVVRALAARGEMTVVVDDLDAVPVSVDADLLTLLRRAPALTLVVMCQQERPIEVRGLVEVDAVVLTGADLGLGAAEVHALLAARGLRSDEAQVTALIAETQGRPDLIRAALVHRRQGDPEPGHTWSGVGLFLEQRWSEVRAQYGRALDVLAVTGLGPAVVAVALDVSRVRAEQAVADLARAGFTAPRSASGQVVLMPSVIRMIERHADPEHPEVIAAHDRLAAYARDRRLGERALFHALEARRWRLAAEMIDADLILLLLNHAALVSRAIEEIPPEIMAEFPAPLAAIRVIQGRPMPEMVGAAAGADPRMAHLAKIATMARARFGGRLEEAAALSRELSAQLAPAAELGRAGADAAVVRVQVATSLFLVGDVSGAMRESDLALAAAGGHALPAQSALGTKALVAALAGTGPEVRALLNRSAALPVREGGMWARTMVWAECARALAALARLDLTEAEGTLARLESVGPDEELWAVIAFIRALASVFGDPSAGLVRLRRTWQAEEARSPQGSLALELLQAVELTLLHATGQGTRAAIRLRGEGDAGTVEGLIDGRAARVLLAFGEPEEARRRAVRWSAVPMTAPWGRVVTGVVAAVAAHRLGDGDEAAAALADAVRTAEQAEVVLPFVTVPWQELSEIADASDNALARDLLDSAPVLAHRDALPAELDPVVLTEREEVVLRELAVEPSQERIATALFVSLNTVKSQIRGIYRKLGASSREEALTAAARIGLLDRE